jgi:hypothetical protein
MTETETETVHDATNPNPLATSATWLGAERLDVYHVRRRGLLMRVIQMLSGRSHRFAAKLPT